MNFADFFQRPTFLKLGEKKFQCAFSDSMQNDSLLVLPFHKFLVLYTYFSIVKLNYFQVLDLCINGDISVSYRNGAVN